MIDCEWFNSIELKGIYVGGIGDDSCCVNHLSSLYNQFHKWNNSLARNTVFFSSTSKVVITSAAKIAPKCNKSTSSIFIQRVEMWWEFRKRKLPTKCQLCKLHQSISITNAFHLLHFAYNNGNTIATTTKKKEETRHKIYEEVNRYK